MIEGKDVDTILDETGLKFGKFGEEKAWLVILEGSSHEYHLAIQIRADWITVAIHPFIDTPDPQGRSNLCCCLAGLNYKMYFAKFVLDDANDIGLIAQLPTDSDLSLLRKSISIVARYADEYYAELSTLGKSLAS